MNMLARVIICVVLAGVTSGCERMFATRIVKSVTIGGKFVLALQGSPQRLIEKGRIDAEHRIVVCDGTEIDVWVIKARRRPKTASRKATVVVIHPLMMSKGWFFSLGERLAADGWDVVLPDLRAHGASGGKYITWGAKDKHDIKTVVDAMIAEKLIEPRVYAMGASLGGCVAIQYAAVDSRCEGVLSLSPPTGVKGAARLIFPLATKGWLDRTIVHAGEIADFDPADASALDAAADLKCPIILAHGRLDFIVPHSHSDRIYAAAGGPKKLISLPLATHSTVQIGREGWIVEQMAALTKMAGP
ncbi:MAG: alpha/beta fold hydrolase [Phycisphaerae bacterium]|nr:alpha/beta fold hydrolase [Phycisphaerae bacterium]